MSSASPSRGAKRHRTSVVEDCRLTNLQFLEARLIERVHRGPIHWDMIVTIGEAGDAENDPTILWPKDRHEIKAGTLTIVSAQPQQGAACEKVNFDPLVMSDGIQPTNDPVLLFRSPAYAISVGKRISGE